uniref:Putative secreted protein n=1 Tax=Panstrongylus lignarius TaxID=156445 RepID=A0A224XUC5_9HEMI
MSKLLTSLNLFKNLLTNLRCFCPCNKYLSCSGNDNLQNVLSAIGFGTTAQGAAVSCNQRTGLGGCIVGEN